MSERRKRDHAALFTIGGKKIGIEFANAAQWGGGAGLYRVKVNGRWHGGQRGTYTFLPLGEALLLVLGLFEGKRLVAPPKSVAPDVRVKDEIRCHYGPIDAVMGIPANVGRGIVKTVPHLEVDGVWYCYVMVWASSTLEKVRCDDIINIRRR